MEAWKESPVWAQVDLWIKIKNAAVSYLNRSIRYDEILVDEPAFLQRVCKQNMTG